MFQDDSQIHLSDSGVNNHLHHWETSVLSSGEMEPSKAQLASF